MGLPGQVQVAVAVQKVEGADWTLLHRRAG